MYRNKDWLQKQYIELKIKVKDIAKQCNIGNDTVYEWLKKFNIELNTEKRKNIINKELLISLYIDNKMSASEIAKKLECSHQTILNYLKKFNIERRKASEAQSIYLYEKGGIAQASESQKLVWERKGYKDKMSNVHKEVHKNNPNLAIEHSAKLQNIELKEWEGFKEPINLRVRKSSDYREWRTNIFERDKYTCAKCKKVGGKLHAHHILNFSTHKDLRFDINNGITLCENCHNPNIKGSFHNIYGNFNNTKEQLNEFLTSQMSK